MWKVLLHRFAKRRCRAIHIIELEHLPRRERVRTDGRYQRELYLRPLVTTPVP